MGATCGTSPWGAGLSIGGFLAWASSYDANHLSYYACDTCWNWIFPYPCNCGWRGLYTGFGWGVFNTGRNTLDGIFSSALLYNEPSDGAVSVTSCAPAADPSASRIFSSAQPTVSSNYYKGAMNHFDGTCRYGNGGGGDQKSCDWINQMVMRSGSWVRVAENGGAFYDDGNRAVPNFIANNKPTLAACQAEADRRGYDTVAMQADWECWGCTGCNYARVGKLEWKKEKKEGVAAGGLFYPCDLSF